MSETIHIEEAGVHQCINCGAYAKEIDQIKHYESCKPGEAKKWEMFYEYAEKEVK